MAEQSYQNDNQTVVLCAQELTEAKVEVPREQIISWIEQAVHEVHADQRRTRKNAEIFYQYGLNPHETKNIKFGAHLQSLSEDHIYNILPNSTSERNELC